ncbi:hypothetical protein GCM10022630_14730 [Thermobifida alba]
MLAARGQLTSPAGRLKGEVQQFPRIGIGHGSSPHDGIRGGTDRRRRGGPTAPPGRGGGGVPVPVGHRRLSLLIMFEPICGHWSEEEHNTQHSALYVIEELLKVINFLLVTVPPRSCAEGNRIK